MIYISVICFALLLYSYVGFPLLVWALSVLRPKKWLRDETLRPSVSIILPAFNEALVLRRCLNSLLALEYPVDRIEILCGSDGSTDLTNSILKQYSEEHPTLRALYFPRQRGKMLVLNDLVFQAKNDILLFVDADVTLQKDALLRHVAHYADADVGGVAGCLAFVGPKQDGVFDSESAYWSVESALRKNEGLIGSTLGLYGGNYSIRRELWQPLPNARVYDDFYAVLHLLTIGRRILYEPKAVAVELYGRSFRDEFNRKRRNASQSLYTLRFFPSLLYRRHSAWMLWPHKLLRWFSGYLLLVLLIGTITSFLAGAEWLSPVVVIEGVFAFLALLGWVAKQMDRSVPIVSQLFWLLNIFRAGMTGVLDFLIASPDLKWSQTTRVADPTTPRPVSQEVGKS